VVAGAHQTFVVTPGKRAAWVGLLAGLMSFFFFSHLAVEKGPEKGGARCSAREPAGIEDPSTPPVIPRSAQEDSMGV
jgi:hypothetical protein